MKSLLHFLLLLALSLLPNAMAYAQAPEITKERLTEFRKLTLDRVTDFQEYLTVIADKKRTMDERLLAVELANGLFVMPPDKEGRPRKALMQVSRKGEKTPRTLTVEQYLKNLLNARYAQIQLTFYDAAVVTDFEKSPDGDYHAVATYFQEFRGFDEKGQIRYDDRTRKDIAVTATASTPYKDLGQVDLKVFFGDVKVTETLPVPIK